MSDEGEGDKGNHYNQNDQNSEPEYIVLYMIALIKKKKIMAIMINRDNPGSTFFCCLWERAAAHSYFVTLLLSHFFSLTLLLTFSFLMQK